MCWQKTYLFILGLFYYSVFMKAAELKLGLFYGIEIRSMVFSVVEGEYVLSGDGQQVAVIRKGTMYHIELGQKGLTVNDTIQSLGTYHQLVFRGISKGNVFQVRPVEPSLASKESDDNLTVGMRDKSIQMINILDLEKYLPGCVEAEGGSNALGEFYKAQAVLSRTFAVRNFARHAPEGFNLCDDVHCQAFNGKSRMNPEIYNAVLETKNIILVGQDGSPIFTAYHANCGGITSSASMAWNKDLPYLVSVHDPFCDISARRNWTRSIPLTEWDQYLELKGINAGIELPMILTGSVRQKYLGPGRRQIPLTTIREDLKLRSSFFTILVKSDSVIIQGHGFGHGVGLCQEGAMEMARVGFSFPDILMFYFHKVRLGSR
jgi:stage II sporulation protein D